MDPAPGKIDQGDEVVIGRQAQHQMFAADPQPEQGPHRREPGAGVGDRAGGGRTILTIAHVREPGKNTDLAAAALEASVVGRRSGASMVARRYTPGMGAVETMEDFFEKLNGGDREGAVALMDEKTEMRVHVGDSVQTLRGVERVGGWFLRGDAGLRMIPGGIRDTGNTYEADLLVVRPGAPTQHIDATFRVEAGRITAINIAPR
jgi:hypothetical protein